MEIQQHDGVVVEAAVISAGLRQAPTRERCVTWGEGGARDLVRLPSLPPLYIGPLRGAPALGDGISKGGRRPRGVACPPSQVGGAPTFRVSQP